MNLTALHKTPVLPACLLLGALLLAGCGSDGKTSTDGTATLSVVSPEAKLAESTVRDYYRDIDDKDLKSAWEKLSKAARENFKGYDNWALGKRGIKSISVTSAQARVVTGSEATVDISYKVTGIDACGDKAKQKFSGSWTLERVGGNWIGKDLKIKQSGGDKPQTDKSKCGSGKQGSATTTSATAPVSGSGSSGSSGSGSSGSSGSSSGSEGDTYDDCDYYGDCYDDYGEDYSEDATPVTPSEQDDGIETNARNYQP